MRFNPYVIKEGRMIQITRKHGEKPGRSVQMITPVRNKILSFVGENKKVKRDTLIEFVKQFNEETGRNTTMSWFKVNSNLFKITNENGVINYELSKIGERILSKTKINENENYFYKVFEGKLITLKRKYTDTHPEKRIALVTPVRQKVLAFVSEKEKVSRQELKEYLKQFNEDNGRNTTIRWFKRNAHLFSVTNENGTKFFSLSKMGKRILSKTLVNESVYIDDFINEDYADSLIKGVAKRLDVDISQYDMRQIKIGMAVELEHGSKSGDAANITNDDPEMTFRIVLAHLIENPKYYTEAKPEDWGIVDYEQDDKSTTAAKEPGDEPEATKPKEEEPEDDDEDFDDYFEPEEFDEEPDDEKSDDEEEKPKEEPVKSSDPVLSDDDEEEKPKEEQSFTLEQREKIISFLDKHAEGTMSDTDEYTKFTELAKEVGVTFEELESHIYKLACKAAESSDIKIEIEGIDDEAASKIKEKIIASKGKLSEEIFAALAKELNLDHEKVEDYAYALAKSELKKNKMTTSRNESAFEEKEVEEDAVFVQQPSSPVATVHNTPGMGNVYLPGAEINGHDGKGSGDVPDSNFVGISPNRGRYATRKMFSIDDFIHHNLQESINEKTEAKFGKKFDKVVSDYKELLANKEKVMKDFVANFKHETDPDKKEKMKKEHLENYKKLNKEIADMELKYNAAIQNLDVDYGDDSE
jgi:hypothetical protein